MLARHRIRLRIGISAAFALAMIPLTMGLVGFLYRNNATLALETADSSMTKAAMGIAEDVNNLLSPVARVVEAAAVLVRIDKGVLRRPEGTRYFYEQMEKLPQVYSLYSGYEVDGGFYQIIHLPKSIEIFGPSSLPVPDGASFVLRVLDTNWGEQTDSFVYLGEWNDVKGMDRGPAKYDPRQRPWYKAAWEDPGIRISEVYTFSSTGKPGLTISKRAAMDSGEPIGVIGADISLDVLSGFLANKQIGKEGRVFIIDGEGRLIGHPNPTIAVKNIDGKLQLSKAVEVDDPVVAKAVSLWEAGRGERFSATVGTNADEYRFAFAPFPKEFGKDWVIGVAVKELDLVGPMRDGSIRILMTGIAVLMLSALAINWLSRLLTRPLQEIVEETQRIQQFDLSGETATRSYIIEVNDLSEAMNRMKQSLRSFSVYVPKELVRMIFASGEKIRVGGVKRTLTIMFTDIKDFTHSAESMPPEQLMESLSAYFHVMSAAIHAHKGVVDKFVGDAIMALWNAPLADDDPMANACRAMLAADAACRELCAEMKAKGLPGFETRLGLHAGDVVVGNVGSEDRMQYTALGSEVNLASRLEALNKLYGTRRLVSETVAAELHDRFLFRTIDMVVPAGTSNAISLYELIGEYEETSPFKVSPEDAERCASWERPFSRYSAHAWEKALADFEAFAKAYPDDGVAQVFIARCKDYIANPPSKDWDTAQRLDHK